MKHKLRRKHYKGRNYHHLTSRYHGGTNTDDNIILIDIEKHEAWHKLFKRKNLQEVITLLTRLESLKNKQGLNKKVVV